MLYQRDMKQVPLEESERFSNESRETKTKELALQSITKNAKNGGPIKTPGLFAFGFSSDWSKRRRELYFKPIAKRRETNQITYDFRHSNEIRSA